MSTDGPTQALAIAVTGASDGIGLATARELVRRGHRVLAHGRSRARAEHAARAVGDAAPVWGDLSSMAEVSALADQIAVLAPRLDVLVNNAGMYARRRTLTEDGLEATMAVNHFAPYLLTRRLLPQIEAAPAGRIITVSSMTHEGADIDVDDLDLSRGWSAYGAYATSKLANVLFTRALSGRLRRATANALHPGVIGTKLLRAGFGAGGGRAEDGARTSVFLATAPEVAGTSGAYFVDCREKRPGRRARDPALAEALWCASAARLAAFLPEAA